MTFARVAIVGISASGKSTFARALARRSGLPLLHGDQLEWMAGWKLRPGLEIDAMHADWIAQPRWIIEGWVDPERAARLSAADLVIDLDYPGWLCAWRMLRRMLRRTRRDEMPEDCVDRFLWHMLDRAFWKKERPSIDSALGAATIKRYVRLKNPRETAAWLAASNAPA